MGHRCPSVLLRMLFGACKGWLGFLVKIGTMRSAPRAKPGKMCCPDSMMQGVVSFRIRTAEKSVFFAKKKQTLAAAEDRAPSVTFATTVNGALHRLRSLS